MQKPFVSVCIVTYNHERYISQCINSALMQSEDALLEILIGDDISTDGTENIVRKISESTQGIVRYFRHTEKKGPAGNLEHLIREARGEYIAHLDGDDCWLPGKIAFQIAFLKAHADCPAVYTNAYCIQDDGSPSGIFSNFISDRVHLRDLIRHGNFLNHSSMVYRAVLRQEILAATPALLDYHIHLCLARHGALGYLNSALTLYRVSSSSSILVQLNDHVRELYWAALCDTLPPLVRPEDLSKGMAEFMRSIFFRSVRIRSMHLLRVWWPRILDQAPAGRAGLIVQACWSIFRTATTEVVSMLCRRLTGNSMKVLYPR